jgi:MFS family permease
LEAAIPWKLIDDAPWCRIYVVLERGAMNKNGRDDTSMADTLTQQYLAGLSKNTFLLACASLFADISTEMLYPVLPVFLTQTLNAGGSAVGLIDGVAQATQNIVQGFSGWLSDKLQKRKSIALAGYLLAAIAKPLIGLSTGWQGVLGARFLDRLGTGTRSAPRDALIASSADEEHRGKAFGLEGVGDNLGAFLGPLLAVFLLLFLHIDLRLIFYLAIIPGLLAVLMIMLVTERPVVVSAKSKLDISLRQFPRAYWKYLLVIALFGIGNSSIAFLILQTQDIGASLEMTILIYTAFNLVAALISYPAGYLSDKWGRKNILLLSFIIFFVTYVGFALTRNMLLIAMLFAFYGLHQGIFRSVGKALATDFVPENLRASGVGWYNTTIGLLGLVASIVAGLLWDHVGHVAVFLYGAVFAAVGSVALLALIPARRNTHAATAR